MEQGKGELIKGNYEEGKMRFLTKCIFWLSAILFVLVCTEKISTERLVLMLVVSQLILSIAISDIERRVSRLERGRGFDNLFNPVLSLQKILDAVKKKREEKKGFTIINKDN